MLENLGAKTVCYKKGDLLLAAGNKVSSVGIVLSGQTHVVRNDIDGNQMIVTELRESDLFGETFACVEMDHIPVTVVAITQCEIMWIDYRRAIMDCTAEDWFHTKLVENMLRLMAFKNIKLNNQLEILSKHSIRERLLTYLGIQAESTGNRVFRIPFDRSALADYLCTNRSALSRELSRMRDNGILEFEKNTFKLL